MRVRSKNFRAALPLAGALLCVCGNALAADPSPGPGIGSVLQMLLGLIAVLGVFGAAAWAMKRSGAVGGGNQRALKLVASIAVGTRERVVLVEVGGQWIVAGVAPGSVNQLALMPRGELIPAAADTNLQGGNAFAGFLRQVMDRRNAK